MANILVLSQYWYPENGVPQRRWAWLSEILINMGHAVTVIAPPAHYNRAVSFSDWLSDAANQKGGVETGPHGERIIRCQYLPSGLSLTGRAMNQASVAITSYLNSLKKSLLFENGATDVVIGTVPALPTAPLTEAVANHLKVPYVIDLRDAWPDLLDQSDDWNAGVGETSVRERVLSKGPKQVVFATVRALVNRALSNAAGIIVTAESLGTYLLEQALRKGGNSTPELVTIRNVFPAKTIFHRQDLEARADDSLNVLYAGTLGRAQKLSNALDAVRIAGSYGVTVNLKLVGAGATKDALRAQVNSQDLSVEILPRVPAEELSKYYEWADTALVHLTDWEPLQRAVPSKTYELMSSKIHISGSIRGETAALINDLHAGHTVQPGDSEALAAMWATLARDRQLLATDERAAQWVEHERLEVSPRKLNYFIDRILDLSAT